MKEEADEAGQASLEECVDDNSLSAFTFLNFVLSAISLAGNVVSNSNNNINNNNNNNNDISNNINIACKI